MVISHMSVEAGALAMFKRREKKRDSRGHKKCAEEKEREEEGEIESEGERKEESLSVTISVIE